jgi:hypothetical protein
MKISISKLKQLIKEELKQVLKERKYYSTDLKDILDDPSWPKQTKRYAWKRVKSKRGYSDENLTALIEGFFPAFKDAYMKCNAAKGTVGDDKTIKRSKRMCEGEAIKAANVVYWDYLGLCADAGASGDVSSASC